MEDKIDSAIEKMADQAKACAQDSTKAYQYSQAALNFAHTKQLLEGQGQRRNKGAGS